MVIQLDAIQTGRHHSSIAWELVRNATKDVYLAEDVHQSYENRRTHFKTQGKYDKTIADIIEETIYNWMYQGNFFLDEKAFRYKGNVV